MKRIFLLSIYFAISSIASAQIEPAFVEPIPVNWDTSKPLYIFASGEKSHLVEVCPEYEKLSLFLKDREGDFAGEKYKASWQDSCQMKISRIGEDVVVTTTCDKGPGTEKITLTPDCNLTKKTWFFNDNLGGVFWKVSETTPADPMVRTALHWVDKEIGGSTQPCRVKIDGWMITHYFKNEEHGEYWFFTKQNQKDVFTSLSYSEEGGLLSGFRSVMLPDGEKMEVVFGPLEKSLYRHPPVKFEETGCQ